jgi:hypothetical protein
MDAFSHSLIFSAEQPASKSFKISGAAISRVRLNAWEFALQTKRAFKTFVLKARPSACFLMRVFTAVTGKRGCVS